VPILVRQTAARPIAALHAPEPGYFRNSLLACRGIEGVAHEVVVAWLNASVIAADHRARTRDARQRSFPQVKLRHLRALPVPPWRDPPSDDFAALARAVARDGRLDLEPRLDALVSAWFGLDPAAHAHVRSEGGA
jgi:hypothetical protein